MKVFETKVIEALKNIDINCSKYFGEFSNPQKVNIDLNNTPIVFIDYVGSKPNGRIKEKHEFYLYIAHLSFSQNKINRANKQYELYDLLDAIKKALNLKTFNNSEPITWGSKSKIFDAATDKGYLTVFNQSISAEI